MTTNSLLIPAVSYSGILAGVTLQPVTSSASMSCFVNFSTANTYLVIRSNGYYPGVNITTTTGSPFITVMFNAGTWNQTIPAVSTGTWYFVGVTAIVGGNVILYWGVAGSNPTYYTVSSSGPSTNAGDTAQVAFEYGPPGVVNAASLRYWTTVALSQSQMFSEAKYATPVRASGLTYHFLSPAATSLTPMLTDTVGNVQQMVSEQSGAGSVLFSSGTGPVLPYAVIQNSLMFGSI